MLLSSPTNATITDGTGVATITDNESAPQVSINDISVSEGDGSSFTITMTTAATGNVTMNYVLSA